MEGLVVEGLVVEGLKKRREPVRHDPSSPPAENPRRIIRVLVVRLRANCVPQEEAQRERAEAEAARKRAEVRQ